MHLFFQWQNEGFWNGKVKSRQISRNLWLFLAIVLLAIFGIFQMENGWRFIGFLEFYSIRNVFIRKFVNLNIFVRVTLLSGHEKDLH